MPAANSAAETITITLSRDQCDTLMLALGMATGGAARLGAQAAHDAIIRLANAIGPQLNPDFYTYAVGEFRSEAPE